MLVISLILMALDSTLIPLCLNPASFWGVCYVVLSAVNMPLQNPIINNDIIPPSLMRVITHPSIVTTPPPMIPYMTYYTKPGTLQEGHIIQFHLTLHRIKPYGIILLLLFYTLAVPDYIILPKYRSVRLKVEQG